ncbi:MAG: type II toxin-antitoxin system VapC family toxin [Moraxellaceae bacterium]|nr:type II toxin-antitoxin system VapC family toxin [Moraxellaceae bacterium]
MLLDTNVVSEIRKVNSNNCPIKFKNWFDNIELSKCYLSVLTLYEIELGILQKQRKDPTQALMLRNWFEQQIKPEFRYRILDLNTKSAINTAKLHVPNPASLVDSFIASTAIENDMILVTRNVKDFATFPVKILNPFE